MKELLLIPIFSMALYLVYVYLRYGMTISISATYKVVQGFEKMWFSMTLWAVAIPIVMVAISGISQQVPQVLFFLAGALICLVAASPAYWTSKHELTAHLIGSYGGIVIGMIACLVHYYSITTLLMVSGFAVLSFLATKLKMENHIYWIEVTAIVTVILVLYIS